MYSLEPVQAPEDTLFLRALLDNQLGLVCAMLDSATGLDEVDKVCRAIVAVFHANDRTTYLLKSIMSREVQAASDAGDMFRANSRATKMFSAYARVLGYDFLVAALKPTVQRIIERNVNLEIDPAKLPEGKTAEQQHEALKKVCGRVLSALEKHAELLPDEFRYVMHFVRTTVDTKFDGHGQRAVVGFMMQRFVNPALAAPAAYKLVSKSTKLSTVAQRSILLVSKVLQNLSQGVGFGVKEPYMAALNPFLKSNNKVMEAMMLAWSSASRHSMLSVTTPDFDSYAAGSLPGPLRLATSGTGGFADSDKVDTLREFVRANPNVLGSLTPREADLLRQSLA